MLRIFENRVLRKLLGPKWDEARRNWTRLHKEEFRAVYSPNFIRVIKSIKMRWVGHVARVKGERFIRGF
jgi:hypothetical protein